MSYSQFTIEDIKTNFDITISENFGIFADIPEIEYSDFLGQSFKEYLPLALAINTEKARSELIIMPILVEIKKPLFSWMCLTMQTFPLKNNYCFKYLFRNLARIPTFS